MEQLINAAKMPYYASAILFPLSVGLLGIIVLIIVERFIVEGKDGAKKKVKLIIALFNVGMPLFASGFYCKDVFDKYNNQAKSIAKNVIAKEYPDATEFEFELTEGYFVENGINYEFEYQKTIGGEEKLIVTTEKGLFENENVKTLDIPKIKGEKNNGTTN